MSEIVDISWNSMDDEQFSHEMEIFKNRFMDWEDTDVSIYIEGQPLFYSKVVVNWGKYSFAVERDGEMVGYTMDSVKDYSNRKLWLTH